MCTTESAVDALVGLGVPLALRTGLARVDDVLRNSLQFGKTSEIIGESGTGKTQLCYALVANFLLNTTFNVAWLDSTGSFRAHRLQEYLVDSPDVTEDVAKSLLKRVAVSRVSNQLQLIDALELIDDYFEEYCFRLAIIDNALEMFDERLLDENLTRSAVMAVVLNRMDTLTDLGCTIITTSCMLCENDDKSEFARTWVQQMHSRLMVERDERGLSTIRLLKAADEHSRQCSFQITSGGIKDIE